MRKYAKPKEAVPRRWLVYQCRNGQTAVILDEPPGPLSDGHRAFTYVGVRHYDGDIDWGHYRWRVDGQFVYDDPDWDLMLETCRVSGSPTGKN